MNYRSRCMKWNFSKNCQHPFVIGFYEYFIEDGFINIVMQYAAGGSLAGFLEGKKQRNEHLNDEAIFFYFTQMTMALDYLHKLNVVHFDLKPDNILMNTSRRILKLADFGIT
uniref:Protein kinase domain-containing protein n=1 Tax=Panagrolaimus sp. JU765 TaxID=591449 RepID=A0AC34RQD2_9BILA